MRKRLWVLTFLACLSSGIVISCGARWLQTGCLSKGIVEIVVGVVLFVLVVLCQSDLFKNKEV